MRILSDGAPICVPALPLLGQVAHAVKSVGFAERQRGDAVAVHAGVQTRVAGEVSILRLTAQQILQPKLHVGPVGTFVMRVPGAEKRQEGQRRDAGIGLRAGPTAVSAGPTPRVHL